MPRRFLSLLAMAGVLVWHGTVFAQAMPQISGGLGLCGSLENAFGPFDYRTVPFASKHIVERVHFTSKVETLTHGATSTLGGDIDYTLRAMPNHYRALMAMVRLGKRTHRSQPPGARYPVECYFDRAERFAPDDPMVHVLYGIYLAKAGRTKEAEHQLSLSEQYGRDNAQVLYNLGIGYLELSRYDRAVEFAKKAEMMGVQFNGLKRRIQQAGKWPQ